MNKNLSRALIWSISTLFVVYAFFLNTASGVFAEAIKNYLKLGDGAASIAMGSFILGFACMQIPAGYLLDRYKIGPIVSGAVLLLALGNFTLSFSHSIASFALSNFFQGVGASFSFLALGKLISQWFSAKMFPILFGLSQSISSISAAIIHYYLVLALQSVTWQAIYQKFGWFGFLLFCCTVVCIKSPGQVRPSKALSLKRSLFTVLKNRQIWLCSFCGATSFGILTAYASFWYLEVQKFYGVDMPTALVISGLVFAGIGVGTPFWGWVSNRIGSRKQVIHISLSLGTICLVMGLYLPHYQFETFALIKVVSFLIGFFLSGSMLFYTSVSEISSAATKAVALGVINTCVFLFNALLLFVPRLFITQDSHTFFTHLWVLPVSLMGSILFTYFIKDTLR